MKQIIFHFFLLIFPVLSPAQIAIIPQPVHIQTSDATFEITRDVEIQISDDELIAEAQFLQDLLFVTHWINIPIKKNEDQGRAAITLSLDPTNAYNNNDAYRLVVNERGIEIKAKSRAGIFYGIQTLRQLLPEVVELTDPSLVPRFTNWVIPAVEIYDYPRFSYRGMHLDVARHFFPVAFVKKYIDLIASYKYNRFHWHLTEDQGWRIEIKKYPKLTEIAAWRDSTLIGNYGSGLYDGIRHGGFYTQNEVREIVAYAAERHVTIIPEIEMPGHSTAAIAAYPELGCFNQDVAVASTWGVFYDIYCPKEETFEFLENVLDEVMALFPGEFIHIGGDEGPKKQWEESEIAQAVIRREGLKDEHELQSYFITRIERYLNSKGKNIIGWDEILEGGLAPRATVMSWRGEEGGIAAAKMGHDVIMTPNGSNYFDHFQFDADREPISIGGLTTLEDVYHYEPVPDTLTEEESKFILGSQGNVWTEYMHTGAKVEYMAFPRVLGLSEVLWTPVDLKNWNEFLERLQSHFKRLDYRGVNYGDHYRD